MRTSKLYLNEAQALVGELLLINTRLQPGDRRREKIPTPKSFGVSGAR